MTSLPAPPGIGDRAPLLANAQAPGAMSVIAFHPPQWDPARQDELDACLTRVDAARRAWSARISIANDHPDAARFGVTGLAAVFIVDEDGLIAWRYVAGLDPLHGEMTPRQCTRRQFVAATLGIAAAILLDPRIGRAQHTPPVARARTAAAPAAATARDVTLTVNGKTVTLTLEPRVTLLDALREYAGLTGSKKGCDHGQCGACTVHIDGRRTLSCLTFAVMHEGESITTIEGLAKANDLHPMQQAFIEHDGFQCGYCTSGQIMSAVAVTSEPWGPTDDDVREAMSGNICRCGAYPGIVAAVQQVRGADGRAGK
jgi:xanthine dehydrogenase YagT iron-sulfur-binding subunit